MNNRINIKIFFIIINLFYFCPDKEHSDKEHTEQVGISDKKTNVILSSTFFLFR